MISEDNITNMIPGIKPPNNARGRFKRFSAISDAEVNATVGRTAYVEKESNQIRKKLPLHRRPRMLFEKEGCQTAKVAIPV
jgi:hypothetical protein